MIIARTPGFAAAIKAAIGSAGFAPWCKVFSGIEMHWQAWSLLKTMGSNYGDWLGKGKVCTKAHDPPLQIRGQQS